MVRPQVLTSFLASLVVVAATAAPGAAQSQTAEKSPSAGRRLEALLGHVAGTAPGTYVARGAALEPAPEGAQIPVMLQADVLRGPNRDARVGIVVGASAPQALEVRLHLATVVSGNETPRFKADAGGSGTPGPMRLVREFSLAPGDYALDAVVGHVTPDGQLIVAVAKSRVTVPDIRGGSLTMTPIVAGEATTTERQASLPFIFGPTTLVPAVDPRASQDGSISVAFRVYNWTASAEEKPDLTVEYLFYEQGTKGLHFFNKVKPQQLNAESLGTAFDPSAGSVAAGMLIPLRAFTFGDFQLAVKVTDNRSKDSAEQRMRFTVAP